MILRLVFLMFGLCVGFSRSSVAGPFDEAGGDLTEKPLAQLSNKDVSEWGQAALAIDAAKWRHGETKHFILHYQSLSHARKCAAKGEKLYTDIQTFFEKPPDLLPGQKSHIYVFGDQAGWRQFTPLTQMGNIAGVTRGQEFFFVDAQAGGGHDPRYRTFYHEMTHLVFNRFFRGRPPLWLNEGIAEYFGQRETSSTAEFRRLMAAMGRFPLDALFEAQTYPAMESARHGFYGEASVVVDFLTYQEDRRKLLPKFVAAMIANDDMGAAVKLYGYPSLNEFKDKYERYRKTRFR